MGLWKSLTPRQLRVAEFAASWLIIWTLDKFADYFWGARPAMQAFMPAVQIAREWALNGYVASFVAGAIVVAFGADVAAWCNKQRFILFPFVALLLGATTGFVMIVFVAKFESRNDPYFFAPSASSLKNPDGSLRDFVKKSIKDLVKPYDTETTVTADAIVSSDKSKWIALTGIVRDVRIYGDRTVVFLEGGNQSGSLTFDASKEALSLKKGVRVFSVCRISEISRNSVDGEHCEMAKPLDH